MVKITTIPKGTRSQSWMGPPRHARLHHSSRFARPASRTDGAIDANGELPETNGTSPTGAKADEKSPSATEINPTSTENAVLGLPDMGLIAQRYTLDLMGNSQQLQIRSWPPQVARRFLKDNSVRLAGR